MASIFTGFVINIGIDIKVETEIRRMPVLLIEAWNSGKEINLFGEY